MNERERWLACVTFEDADRYIFEHSFGLMPGTLERWHNEGLPEEIGESEIRDYFGFDRPPIGLPVNFGLHPPFEQKTLSDKNGIIITQDSMGTKRKLKKGVTTISLPYEFPIAGPDDWSEYESRLQYSPERISDELESKHNQARHNGRPIRVGWKGFYWFPRDLMGDEKLCLSYYTQPDFIKKLLQTYSNMLFVVSEEMLGRVDVDWMHMSEDMCYRSAMMVSPDIFREFMMPHYKRIIGLYRSHGTRIFSVDTDGHLGQLLPLLIEAGINAVLPCEVRAGNDICELREKYGEQMAFMRGINKLALADNPTPLLPMKNSSTSNPQKAIEDEISYRVPPMIRTGGYVAGLDHRVVPETSLENFTFYVRKVRETLGLCLDVPVFSGKQ
ncbi:MAG: hypothetical protein KGZ25_09525 [Planctomycetes bacterium]|nr:hypothetical protein [Planctomycetota bacterium]